MDIVCSKCKGRLEEGLSFASAPTVSEEIEETYKMRVAVNYSCVECQRVYTQYTDWEWLLESDAVSAQVRKKKLSLVLTLKPEEDKAEDIKPTPDEGEVISQKKHLRLIQGGRSNEDPFDMRKKK